MSITPKKPNYHVKTTTVRTDLQKEEERRYVHFQTIENDVLVFDKYELGGEEHREDGPSWCTWYEDGNPKHESWQRHGKYYRATSGPTYTTWYEGGQIEILCYGNDEDSDNDCASDGLMEKSWYLNGQVREEKYDSYAKVRKGKYTYARYYEDGTLDCKVCFATVNENINKCVHSLLLISI
tara:strand:+ start:3582 stop:4124 length:543 start_codon:yes stop_codon:yes gene_type:complete